MWFKSTKGKGEAMILRVSYFELITQAFSRIFDIKTCSRHFCLPKCQILGLLDKPVRNKQDCHKGTSQWFRSICRQRGPRSTLQILALSSLFPKLDFTPKMMFVSLPKWFLIFNLTLISGTSNEIDLSGIKKWSKLICLGSKSDPVR